MILVKEIELQDYYPHRGIIELFNDIRDYQLYDDLKEWLSTHFGDDEVVLEEELDDYLLGIMGEFREWVATKTAIIDNRG